MMRPHGFLHVAGRALPGTLVSGWAPAASGSREIRLVVRDEDGADVDALRRGVEFALADVEWRARLMRVLLAVTRVRGNASRDERCDTAAVVQVVVAHADSHAFDGQDEWGTAVYTCPLREWRPDAWSVASVTPSPYHPHDLDWHPRLDTPEAASLNARFRQHAGVPMDQDAWRGWMAVQVAFELAVRSAAGERDPLAFSFDGHKGTPLRFSEDGHLVQPTVRLSGGRPVLVAAIDYDAFVA